MSNFNIAESLPSQARHSPQRLAVICEHRADDLKRTRLTFAELEAESNSLAWGLSDYGVRPGMRTLLAVRPGLEFVSLTFALFKIGAIPVLIDPGMGIRNFIACIRHVRPSALIALPLAHTVCRLMAGDIFHECAASIKIGSGLALGRCIRLEAVRCAGTDRGIFEPAATFRDTLAAILFTSGGTGVPKGVCYEHGMFAAQIEAIRNHYGIEPGEIDLPAFPLFALFSTALGTTCVIPDMNPSRPAKCDPAKLIASIQSAGVTYSFGSPAIWKRVGAYFASHSIKLSGIRRIFMAGAPVRAEVIKPVMDALSPGAEVHIPYGATEALPVCSIRGSEVLRETWPLTRAGKGYCVGAPIAKTQVKICAPEALNTIALPPSEIGEILVSGPVVTKEYFHMPEETAKSKLLDAEGRLWHRMGDMGYRDPQGRIWFCGRKVHRVIGDNGVIHYSVCREAVLESFLEGFGHVVRTALVRISDDGPGMVVERSGTFTLSSKIRDAWREQEVGKLVPALYLYPWSFPVDVRHNAKIDRERLGRWASSRKPL